jgi:hypothetical protein
MPTSKRKLQRFLIRIVFEEFWRFKHICRLVAEIAEVLPR